jgi:hypothetical protein
MSRPRAYAEVVTSAARTATGQSSALTAPTASQMLLAVDVTASSGTTPTLDITVEWTPDGTNWFVSDTSDAFAQITAGKKTVKAFAVKAAQYRVKWTIAGTTPSFTFSVSAAAA